MIRKLKHLFWPLLILGCTQSTEPTIGGTEEDWVGGDWITVGPEVGGKAIEDSTPHVSSNCTDYPKTKAPDNHFGDSVAILSVFSPTCHFSKSRIYRENSPIRFLFYAYGFKGELEGFSMGSYILMWDQKDHAGVKLPGEYEWRTIITFGNRVVKKYKGKWKV